MQQLDAGRSGERLGVEVRHAAGAEASVGQLAGLALGELDELAQVVRRQARLDREDKRGARHHQGRDEILHRIVGQLAVEIQVRRQRRVVRE
jgi:hypothetical protein